MSHTSENDGRLPWLVTFSDLFLLLLTAFVLRLSMSSPKEAEPPKNVASAQMIAAQKLQRVKELQKSISTALIGEQENPTTSVQESAEKLKDTFTIIPTDRGITLRLAEGSFLSGSREISTQTNNAVEKLAAAIRDRKVKILIEGHTDTVPIKTTEFPSNWELSTARAISVADKLISLGLPGGEISAVGYADTRPIAANDIEQNRALNRRVEVSIVDN